MSAAYEAGILEAARAGAIDGASVMVRRSPDRLGELLGTGIDAGLHLEGRDEEETLDATELAEQLRDFERLAGRPPDHLDGHHHCHAGGAAELVAVTAASRGIPVRSVDPDHRTLLRR